MQEVFQERAWHTRREGWQGGVIHNALYVLSLPTPWQREECYQPKHPDEVHRDFVTNLMFSNKNKNLSFFLAQVLFGLVSLNFWYRCQPACRIDLHEVALAATNACKRSTKQRSCISTGQLQSHYYYSRALPPMFCRICILFYLGLRR